MGGAPAVHLMERVLAQTGSAAAQAIRIDFTQGDNGGIGLSIGGRSFQIPSQHSRQNSFTHNDVATDFVPKPTSQRWQEEMALAPGHTKRSLARIVLHVVNQLLPSARHRAKDSAAQAVRSEAEIPEAIADLPEKDSNEDSDAPVHVGPQSSPPTAIGNDNADIPMGKQSRS